MVVLDIQMPEDCFCCPLFNKTYLFCVVGAQECIDRYGYDSNVKPDWCPIVDISDPNDLISRNQAIDKFEWYIEEEYMHPDFIHADHALRMLEELPCGLPLPNPYEGD